MANCDGNIVLKVLEGNAVEATVTITNTATGLLFDPANVYAWAFARGSTPGSLAVTRLSQGVYQTLFTPTSPGPWVVRMSDSASTPAGAQFTVEGFVNASPLSS